MKYYSKSLLVLENDILLGSVFLFLSLSVMIASCLMVLLVIFITTKNIEVYFLFLIYVCLYILVNNFLLKLLMKKILKVNSSNAMRYSVYNIKSCKNVFKRISVSIKDIMQSFRQGAEFIKYEKIVLSSPSNKVFSSKKVKKI